MSNRWAVNAFFLVNGFVYANWAARIPALQEQFSLDNSQIGFILLAHSIGAFLAMPLTGQLISRFTSKRITIFSGLVFPIFFLAIPWSVGFYSLLVPFFFMGAATGVMDVAMNAQAVEVEKYLKKPIMTMFHALFSIGMVIGGFLGSLMIDFEIAVKSHFPFVFIASMMIILFSSSYLFSDRPEKSEGGPWLVLPKGPIISLGVIAFCCMMGEGAIADWSTLYMKEIVQSSEFLRAMGLTVFAATMTIGRLFGDYGRLQLGDKKMLLWGGMISVLGMLVVLSVVNSAVVILGFAFLGLGLSNIVPIVYSLAGNMEGIKPGVGIAMATTIGYSGFMIGPPIIGFVADASSLYYSMILLAFLFLVMFVLIRAKA